MLIRKVGKDRKINTIFNKTLHVLGHAEIFEPIGNLLHRRPRGNLPATTKADSLARSLKSCSRPLRGPCLRWVNRDRNPMSALRPFTPQFQT